MCNFELNCESCQASMNAVCYSFQYYYQMTGDVWFVMNENGAELTLNECCHSGSFDIPAITTPSWMVMLTFFKNVILLDILAKSADLCVSETSRFHQISSEDFNVARMLQEGYLITLYNNVFATFPLVHQKTLPQHYLTTLPQPYYNIAATFQQRGIVSWVANIL